MVCTNIIPAWTILDQIVSHIRLSFAIGSFPVRCSNIWDILLFSCISPVVIFTVNNLIIDTLLSYNIIFMFFWVYILVMNIPQFNKITACFYVKTIFKVILYEIFVINTHVVKGLSQQKLFRYDSWPVPLMMGPKDFIVHCLS